MKPVVNVKIVSDVVCPFCYVGIRHLQEASKIADVDLNVTWEPFYLNDHEISMPEEGIDLETYLFHKFGDRGIQMLQDPNTRGRTQGKVGIDEASAKEAVKDAKNLHEVDEREKRFKQQRISGVPFFLIERKDGQRPIGFSGAQPIDIMAEQLEEATEE